MDLVDPSSTEHSDEIALILDLARWSHHCIMTGRALQDIVALKLTKGVVLESIRNHIQSKAPIYALLQEQTKLLAYVFLPCKVTDTNHELYVKVQVSRCSGTTEKLIVISAHKPHFPLPLDKGVGEKK